MDFETQRLLGRALGFILWPLLIAAFVAVLLWAVRRFAPKAEWWLFSPMSGVIQRLAGRVRREAPSVPPRVRADPNQSGQRPQAPEQDTAA